MAEVVATGSLTAHEHDKEWQTVLHASLDTGAGYTFSGQDFVNWLLRLRHCKSRAQAQKLGELLRQRDVLRHVRRDARFLDDDGQRYVLRADDTFDEDQRLLHLVSVALPPSYVIARTNGYVMAQWFTSEGSTVHSYRFLVLDCENRFLHVYDSRSSPATRRSIALYAEGIEVEISTLTAENLAKKAASDPVPVASAASGGKDSDGGVYVPESLKLEKKPAVMRYDSGAVATDSDTDTEEDEDHEGSDDLMPRAARFFAAEMLDVDPTASSDGDQGRTGRRSGGAATTSSLAAAAAGGTGGTGSTPAEPSASSSGVSASADSAAASTAEGGPSPPELDSNSADKADLSIVVHVRAPKKNRRVYFAKTFQQKRVWMRALMRATQPVEDRKRLSHYQLQLGGFGLTGGEFALGDDPHQQLPTLRAPAVGLRRLQSGFVRFSPAQRSAAASAALPTLQSKRPSSSRQLLGSPLGGDGSPLNSPRGQQRMPDSPSSPLMSAASPSSAEATMQAQKMLRAPRLRQDVLQDRARERTEREQRRWSRHHQATAAAAAAAAASGDGGGRFGSLGAGTGIQRASSSRTVLGSLSHRGTGSLMDGRVGGTERAGLLAGSLPSSYDPRAGLVLQTSGFGTTDASMSPRQYDNGGGSPMMTASLFREEGADETVRDAQLRRSGALGAARRPAVSSGKRRITDLAAVNVATWSEGDDDVSAPSSGDNLASEAARAMRLHAQESSPVRQRSASGDALPTHRAEGLADLGHRYSMATPHGGIDQASRNNHGHHHGIGSLPASGSLVSASQRYLGTDRDLVVADPASDEHGRLIDADDAYNDDDDEVASTAPGDIGALIMEDYHGDGIGSAANTDTPGQSGLSAIMRGRHHAAHPSVPLMASSMPAQSSPLGRRGVAPPHLPISSGATHTVEASAWLPAGHASQSTSHLRIDPSEQHRLPAMHGLPISLTAKDLVESPAWGIASRDRHDGYGEDSESVFTPASELGRVLDSSASELARHAGIPGDDESVAGADDLYAYQASVRSSYAGRRGGGAGTTPELAPLPAPAVRSSADLTAWLGSIGLAGLYARPFRCLVATAGSWAPILALSPAILDLVGVVVPEHRVLLLRTKPQLAPDLAPPMDENTMLLALVGWLPRSLPAGAPLFKRASPIPGFVVDSAQAGDDMTEEGNVRHPDAHARIAQGDSETYEHSAGPGSSSAACDDFASVQHDQALKAAGQAAGDSDSIFSADGTEDHGHGIPDKVTIWNSLCGELLFPRSDTHRLVRPARLRDTSLPVVTRMKLRAAGKKIFAGRRGLAALHITTALRKLDQLAGAAAPQFAAVRRAFPRKPRAVDDAVMLLAQADLAAGKTSSTALRAWKGTGAVPRRSSKGKSKSKRRDTGSVVPESSSASQYHVRQGYDDDNADAVSEGGRSFMSMFSSPRRAPAMSLGGASEVFVDDSSKWLPSGTRGYEGDGPMSGRIDTLGPDDDIDEWGLDDLPSDDMLDGADSAFPLSSGHENDSELDALGDHLSIDSARHSGHVIASPQTPSPATPRASVHPTTPAGTGQSERSGLLLLGSTRAGYGAMAEFGGVESASLILPPHLQIETPPRQRQVISRSSGSRGSFASDLSDASSGRVPSLRLAKSSGGSSNLLDMLDRAEDDLFAGPQRQAAIDSPMPALQIAGAGEQEGALTLPEDPLAQPATTPIGKMHKLDSIAVTGTDTVPTGECGPSMIPRRNRAMTAGISSGFVSPDARSTSDTTPSFSDHKALLESTVPGQARAVSSHLASVRASHLTTPPSKPSLLAANRGAGGVASASKVGQRTARSHSITVAGPATAPQADRKGSASSSTAMAVGASPIRPVGSFATLTSSASQADSHPRLDEELSRLLPAGSSPSAVLTSALRAGITAVTEAILPAATAAAEARQLHWNRSKGSSARAAASSPSRTAAGGRASRVTVPDPDSMSMSEARAVSKHLSQHAGRLAVLWARILTAAEAFQPIVEQAQAVTASERQPATGFGSIVGHLPEACEQRFPALTLRLAVEACAEDGLAGDGEDATRAAWQSSASQAASAELCGSVESSMRRDMRRAYGKGDVPTPFCEAATAIATSGTASLLAALDHEKTDPYAVIEAEDAAALRRIAHHATAIALASLAAAHTAIVLDCGVHPVATLLQLISAELLSVYGPMGASAILLSNTTDSALGPQVHEDVCDRATTAATVADEIRSHWKRQFQDWTATASLLDPPAACVRICRFADEAQATRMHAVRQHWQVAGPCVLWDMATAWPQLPMRRRDSTDHEADCQEAAADAHRRRRSGDVSPSPSSSSHAEERRRWLYMASQTSLGDAGEAQSHSRRQSSSPEHSGSGRPASSSSGHDAAALAPPKRRQRASQLRRRATALVSETLDSPLFEELSRRGCHALVEATCHERLSPHVYRVFDALLEDQTVEHIGRTSDAGELWTLEHGGGVPDWIIQGLEEEPEPSLIDPDHNDSSVEQPDNDASEREDSSDEDDSLWDELPATDPDNRSDMLRLAVGATASQLAQVFGSSQWRSLPPHRRLQGLWSVSRRALQCYTAYISWLLRGGLGLPTDSPHIEDDEALQSAIRDVPKWQSYLQNRVAIAASTVGLDMASQLGMEALLQGCRHGPLSHAGRDPASKRNAADRAVAMFQACIATNPRVNATVTSAVQAMYLIYPRDQYGSGEVYSVLAQVETAVNSLVMCLAALREA